MLVSTLSSAAVAVCLLLEYEEFDVASMGEHVFLSIDLFWYDKHHMSLSIDVRIDENGAWRNLSHDVSSVAETLS
jgi:hypothetical protein